ncbi:MAG: AAA family ATPase [Oscillospiraceae bacterium]|jgi:septum site-determining protein MinD|nr:AAA family ATPase [Oscillospiraceae bacterium]
MGKIIATASGKGGTGKTTTVAAVAACLASLECRTLAIDCDAGLRNLDLALGMQDFAVSDLGDVLSGRMTLDEAVSEHPKVRGLYFIAAPAYRMPEELAPDAMDELVRAAAESFDFVLLDAPAGIGSGFTLATRAADTVLIVTTPELPSCRDAARAAEVLSGGGNREIRLVVNRVPPRRRRDVEPLIDEVGLQLIGVVREDPHILRSVATGEPLVLRATDGAARDFLDIARRLRGDEIPI